MGACLERLPHARGGVSVSTRRHRTIPRSSPRSWGCFRAYRHHVGRMAVFPTLVGVFLRSFHFCIASASLPHARGGVSDAGHVGHVVPDGLPHARGGVSTAGSWCRCHCSSSPRSWGCFFHWSLSGMMCGVFPTLVGVFPRSSSSASSRSSLPHARGGVSLSSTPSKSRPMSSPRSWGCFYLRHPVFQGRRVFPTLVGVFLSVLLLTMGPSRL